jgi:hypothetical protein
LSATGREAKALKESEVEEAILRQSMACHSESVTKSDYQLAARLRVRETEAESPAAAAIFAKAARLADLLAGRTPEDDVALAVQLIEEENA